MDVHLRLTEGEAAELRTFANQSRRSVDALATGVVRQWLGRRRELSAHVDRIVTEDAELLRRLADP